MNIAGGALPPIASSFTMLDGHQGSEAEAVSTSITLIDIVICSFALHLVGSPSELFALLWELSTKAVWLVVLSPHKKPEVCQYNILLANFIELWPDQRWMGMGKVEFGNLV